MGQKSEPRGYDQVYVLGRDSSGNPHGARFFLLKDNIVSAAMDMKCRVLIRQPDAVCRLAMKLPVGRVFATGKIVTLLIPHIGRELYEQILKAVQIADIQENARIAAAISATVH